MSRTAFRIIAAAAMSFALASGGHWLAYTLLARRGGNNKDDFIMIYLIELLLILPLVSVLIGILIGWFEERNHWWLAGVSLAPLLGYALYDSFAGPLLILSLVYLFLASSSALLTAAFKSKWRRGVLKAG